MTPKTIMVVAGDPSGDAIAADLVRALAAALPDARFIGAGGPLMAAAGVANSFDLTAEAVIGVSDALKKLPRLGRYKKQLTRLAQSQKPDLIILVDFSYFNQKLARAPPRPDLGWPAAQNSQICFTAGLGFSSGPRGGHGAGLRPVAMPFSL